MVHLLGVFRHYYKYCINSRNDQWQASGVSSGTILVYRKDHQQNLPSAVRHVLLVERIINPFGTSFPCYNFYNRGVIIRLFTSSARGQEVKHGYVGSFMLRPCRKTPPCITTIVTRTDANQCNIIPQSGTVVAVAVTVNFYRPFFPLKSQEEQDISQSHSRRVACVRIIKGRIEPDNHRTCFHQQVP